MEIKCPVKDVPKLGFGLMRMPKLSPADDKSVDIEMVKKMVDKFISAGFCYFDTAFMYHGGESENVVKAALTSRYPRDRYLLADKMPLWEIEDSSFYEKTFQTQLDKCGVDYFDFYLLHSMNAEKYEMVQRTGGFDFLKSLKADGRAKFIGFSFHDTADVLDKILTEHPEVEFVQLQINYIDWENEKVQSHKCYDVVRKHNKGVTIMEPVKGGSLAVTAPETQKIFKDYDPDSSIASWALRFALSLEGVIVVLSGMSALDQLEDNLKTASERRPFSEEEKSVLEAAIKSLHAVPTIECTACKYCMTSCPQQINTPDIIALLNDYSRFQSLPNAKRTYGMRTANGGKASSCLSCGVCEDYCPQHIKIPKVLKKAAELFEN